MESLKAIFLSATWWIHNVQKISHVYSRPHGQMSYYNSSELLQVLYARPK